MGAAPQSNPNLIWHVVDGEAIVLDTSTGYHFSFDTMGTEIWQRLNDGESVDDVAAAIARKYAADERVVRQDVQEFVQELRSAKLWS
jgi:hypothetical protein